MTKWPSSPEMRKAGVTAEVQKQIQGQQKAFNTARRLSQIENANQSTYQVEKIRLLTWAWSHMGKAHQTTADKADADGKEALKRAIHSHKRQGEILSSLQELQMQSSASRAAQSAVHDVVGNVVRQLPAMVPLERPAKRSRA